MSLLVLTAVCAMIAAAGGAPAPVRLAALVFGGALACGGASALNHVLDRDIDRLMGPRTASRPVAAGPHPAGARDRLGLPSAGRCRSSVWRRSPTCSRPCSRSAGGAFYVVIYTLWLKRTTAQNIVIGGAAGRDPAAGRLGGGLGRLGLGACCCSRSCCCGRRRTSGRCAAVGAPGYTAAGVPMLPVVRGARPTAVRVLLYSVALVAVTLVPGATRDVRRGVSGGGACCWGRCSAGWRGGCGGTRRRRGRRSCSTTRCCTSRCCSWRWRWTRSCAEGRLRWGPAPAARSAGGQVIGCGLGSRRPHPFAPLTLQSRRGVSGFVALAGS